MRGAQTPCPFLGNCDHACLLPGSKSAYVAMFITLASLCVRILLQAQYLELLDTRKWLPAVADIFSAADSQIAVEEEEDQNGHYYEAEDSEYDDDDDVDEETDQQPGPQNGHHTAASARTSAAAASLSPPRFLFQVCVSMISRCFGMS